MTTRHSRPTPATESAAPAIRRFDAGDSAVELTEIVRACWHDGYAGFVTHHDIDALFDGLLEMRGSWLQRRGGLIDRFVAQRDGRVVGFVEAGHLRDPDCGEIVSLYVHPRHQGAGIGSALWDEACTALRRAGESSLEVWAVTGAKSCVFYEAKGCVAEGDGRLWIARTELAVTCYRNDLVVSG